MIESLVKLISFYCFDDAIFFVVFPPCFLTAMSVCLPPSHFSSFASLLCRLAGVGPMHNTESQIGYYEDFHFYCQRSAHSRLMRIRIHLVCRRGTIYLTVHIQSERRARTHQKPHLPAYVCMCAYVFVCLLVHVAPTDQHTAHYYLCTEDIKCVRIL